MVHDRTNKLRYTYIACRVYIMNNRGPCIAPNVSMYHSQRIKFVFVLDDFTTTFSLLFVKCNLTQSSVCRRIQ